MLTDSASVSVLVLLLEGLVDHCGGSFGQINAGVCFFAMWCSSSFSFG